MLQAQHKYTPLNRDNLTCLAMDAREGMHDGHIFK